jgi:serine/threonine protein phosphatase PrpC
VEPTRKLTLAAASHSEASPVTQIDRDFVASEPELGFFILCRGLNDDASGEFAAHAAGDTIVNLIRPQAGALGRAPATRENCAKVAKWMATAVERASIHLHELGKQPQFPRGLGATCMCLVFIDDKVITAHIGNTRAYMLRGADIFQLGQDHTRANDAPEGRPAVFASSGPSAFAGILTQSMGTRAQVSADTSIFDVRPGDTFLMCTEGLYRFVPNLGDLSSLLSGPTLAVMPPAVVATARSNGSQDAAAGIIIRASPGVVQVTRQELEQRKPDAPRHELAAQSPASANPQPGTALPGEKKVEGPARMSAVPDDPEITALQRTKLFSDLDPDELAEVKPRLIKRAFHQGQMVVREGDNSTSMFIIVSGKMNVSRGGEKITTLLAGQHFGEMALLSARPRSASVDSKSNARCMELSRKAFDALAEQNPRLGFKILHKIATSMAVRLENELSKRLPPVASKPPSGKRR